ALALKVAHHVHGQDAVGVSVGVDRVVAAVGGLIALAGQLLHAGDAVLAVVGGGGGLDVVGVALGDDAAGGAQGDGSLAQVLDGGIGGHAVEGGHGILGGEGLAVELGHQHIHGALGAHLLLEEVLADAVGHVALLAGGAQLLALHDLQGQLVHGGSGLAHAGGGVGGGDDEDLVLQIGAGVLLIHAGEHGDPQLVLHGGADGGAGVAVAAGVEGGAGQEEVGLLGLDPL